MADDRIVKDIKELDFNAVDFSNGDWSWSCGGHPFKNREWHIDHYEGHPAGDIVETCYALPPCMNEMINLIFQWGRDDKLRDIRAALGI